MKKQFPFILSISMLIMSCAPILSKEIMTGATLNVPPGQIIDNPRDYEGEILILGGVIHNTIATDRGSLIEAVYVPLTSKGYLKGIESSSGRYLALYPRDRGFLDPMIFRKRRNITVAGKFVGIEKRNIDAMEYSYPMFEIKELHLWEDRDEIDLTTECGKYKEWKRDRYQGTSFIKPERKWEMDNILSRAIHIPYYEDNHTAAGVLYTPLPVKENVTDSQAVPHAEEVLIRDETFSESPKFNQLQPDSTEVVEGMDDSSRLPEQKESSDQIQPLSEPGYDRKVDTPGSDPLPPSPEAEEIQIPKREESVHLDEARDKPVKPEEREKVPEISQSMKKGGAPGGKEYYVQVGAWKVSQYAEEMLEKLKIHYPETTIVKENNFNKVRIYGVRTKEEGVRISEDLEKKFKIQSIIVLTNR